MFDPVSDHDRPGDHSDGDGGGPGAGAGQHVLAGLQSRLCRLLLHQQLAPRTLKLPGGLPGLSPPGQESSGCPRQAAGVQTVAPHSHTIVTTASYSRASHQVNYSGK